MYLVGRRPQIKKKKRLCEIQAGKYTCRCEGKDDQIGLYFRESTMEGTKSFSMISTNKILHFSLLQTYWTNYIIVKRKQSSFQLLRTVDTCSFHSHRAVQGSCTENGAEYCSSFDRNERSPLSVVPKPNRNTR